MASSGPKATGTLTITLVTGAGAGPFTLTISAAAASVQGVGAADQLVRTIYVRGGFWASDGVFYPVSQIAKIESA